MCQIISFIIFIYILWDLCDRDIFATSCMRHHEFSFDVQCEAVV